MPELATFVKFKVLEPEFVETFLSSLSFKKENLSEQEYYISFRKAVIENFIYNLKGEVSESLRMMSRKSADACLDALYTGAIMLNPGLDVDSWLNISYTSDYIKKTDPLKGPEDIDDDVAQAFIESLKNFKKSSNPKFDLEDFPFGAKKTSSNKKIKPISKEKFFGLENYLKSKIIRTR